MEGYSFYAKESERQLAIADYYIAMYEPKTVVQRFFEDGEESNRNQEAAVKSEGALKAAINAIKQMISKAITSVTNFIQTMFMDKNEKNRFLKFKQMAAENDEFKGKRITVKNFREIDKRYQETLKEIDQAIAAVERSKSERSKQITDKVTKTVENTLTNIKDGATAVVSVDAALRMAENSQQVAKMIKSTLEKENGIMDALERELGEARAKDFKDKIDSLSKKVSLHRLKVRILGQYTGTMSGALNQIVTDFENIFSTDTSLKGNLKRVSNTRIIDDAIGAYNTKTDSNETKTSLAIKGAKGYMKAKGIKNDIEKEKRQVQKKAAEASKKAKKKASERQEEIKNIRKFITS